MTPMELTMVCVPWQAGGWGRPSTGQVNKHNQLREKRIMRTVTQDAVTCGDRASL